MWRFLFLDRRIKDREDVENVLDSLETPTEEKKDIMERFRGLN